MKGVKQQVPGALPSDKKQSHNRWKLLQKTHYRGATLGFLQLIFNTSKKYNQLYPSVEWIAKQPELQRVTPRRVQQIINELKADGVLIVTPYSGDRRRNFYSLDYDKLAERASQPKPARNTRTRKHQPEFIGTAPFECDHDSPYIRLHLCQHCLRSLSRKLLQAGINPWELLQLGLHEEISPNDEEIDETISSIETAEVAENTGCNQQSDTEKLDQTISSNLENREYTKQTSSNSEENFVYSTKQISSNQRNKFRVFSDENSCQETESKQDAEQQTSPTKGFTEVFTEVITTSPCLQHADSQRRRTASLENPKPESMPESSSVEVSSIRSVESAPVSPVSPDAALSTPVARSEAVTAPVWGSPRSYLSEEEIRRMVDQAIQTK